MSYCAQGRLFTFFDGSFNEYGDNCRLLLVLKALEDDELIWRLESKRKGRRNRYPVRMLWHVSDRGQSVWHTDRERTYMGVESQ